MKKSRGQVVVPNGEGQLSLPLPFRQTDLKSIVGGKVFQFLSLGDPLSLTNKRARDPASIFINVNTPREERRHYLSTFLGQRPSESAMRQLMSTSTVLEVNKDGKIILPARVKLLFEDTTSRARIILLPRNGGEQIDGFALQFQPKGGHHNIAI